MNKRIVICADGTWNRPEKDPRKDTPTNVKKFYRPIDHGQGDILIHQSVKQRREQDSSYRPGNLSDYIEQHGRDGHLAR